MSFETIEYAVEQGVATLRLNRPETLNSFNTQMHREVREALTRVRKDPAVRRMLVSGPLEHLFDAPKARALAMKRLSPVAQGYLESLCE